MKPSILKLIVPLLAASAAHAAAAQYEWELNNNLSPSIGTGALNILSSTPATSYSTGTINGKSGTYLNVPKMTSNSNEGLTLTLPSSGPNGGGSYINQYTLALDIYVPTPTNGNNYTALFQTQTTNPSGNDADLYIYGASGSGEIGDGSGLGGYSAANSFTYNAWHRVVLSVNTATANGANIYIDGTKVFTSSATALGLDGRYSLNSNQNSGPDVLLFNEGASTLGTYTNPVEVNSIAFTDTVLSSSQVAALGSANTDGIFAVPEPGTLSLVALAGVVLLVGARCRRPQAHA